MRQRWAECDLGIALVRISWTLILSLAVLAPLILRHIFYDLHFG